MTVTQDRNAGERDTPNTDPEVAREPTPQDIAKAKETQEIEDGHRYPTAEFLAAREAAKPASDRKKAFGKKPGEGGDKKPFADKKAFGDKKAYAEKKPGGKPGGKGDGKDAPKATDRIAKVLARAGLASRREVERLIGLGKIAVNGRILETPAVLVSSVDVITVDGQVIGKAEATRVWRYHKPVGLITTHSDPQGRPTLFEQLPSDLPRVISVGRLDLNSEGLLLLTNDGELARALEKPSSGWVRRYRVRALGHTSQQRLDSLKGGTTVEGVIYGPMEATLDKVAEKADGRANVWLTVAITEGKNREVRKVLESIGLKVNRLIRLAYGPFLLGNLESGQVEEVGPRVIRELLGEVVSLKNLPPEGASQTQDAPRGRGMPRADAGRGSAPAGRRGGGDRFAEKAPGKAFGGKAFGGKPGFAEKRDYKPRDFDERPRFAGDGEARDRKPAEDGDFVRPERRPEPRSRDRGPSDPRAGFTPRPDRGAGNDRKPAGRAFPPRDSVPQGEAGAYERAKREFGPRPDRAEGDKPAYKKPYGARSDATGGERKSYPPRDGAKPFSRDRGPVDARKSYAPRPDRDGAAGGERKSYAKPFRSDRAPDDARKSYAPRPDRDGAAGGERKSYAKPFRSDRAPDDARKSYTPRPDRDGAAGGERKSYPPRDGAKPFRSDGDRPRSPSSRAPSSRGDFSKSPRPDGPRPDGGGYKGKPSSGPRSFAGKPFSGKPGGNKPPFNRKPPRD